MSAEIRLQKYLAECGVASRRRSEELIAQGKVMVNGKTITELGVKVIPDRDKVYVNGKEVKPVEKKLYIMLNKPEGYITTAVEQFGRPSVMDLIKGIAERVFPIGRLDKDTSGLLLLTNDGEFAYTLMHPKHHIRKKYIAELRGTPDTTKLAKFRKGMKIEDYTTSPAEIKLLSSKKRTSVVEIVIYEGRNRQVKKMCSHIGHPVVNLKRVAIGNLDLGNLPEGEWRHLTKRELGMVDQ